MSAILTFSTKVRCLLELSAFNCVSDYPTGVREEANNARVITENRFLMADIGDETEQC